MAARRGAVREKVAVRGIFVANTSFACEVDGVPVSIHQGRTTVSEDDPQGKQLLKSCPEYWDPVEQSVTFGGEPKGVTGLPRDPQGTEDTKEKVIRNG